MVDKTYSVSQKQARVFVAFSICPSLKRAHRLVEVRRGMMAFETLYLHRPLMSSVLYRSKATTAIQTSGTVVGDDDKSLCSRL